MKSRIDSNLLEGLQELETAYRIDQPACDGTRDAVLKMVSRPEPVTPGFLRDLGLVLLLFLGWRGALFVADYVGRSMSVPLTQEQYYPASPFWDGYIRHDSLHYARIVREGYVREKIGPFKGAAPLAAFFPLYPRLVKELTRARVPGIGRLFKTSWPAGLVLSNAALVLGMVYMLRIARMTLDEEGARRSLVYLLAFPSSFFFSCYYTESVFLLTTAASFHHFLRGQHLRSGCWGLLATTSRSPGIMLLPAFLLGHLWTRRFRVARSDLSLLWLGLIPCGLLLVMGNLYVKLGDPMAFSSARAVWGRGYTMPHATLVSAVRSIDWSFPYRDFVNTVWAGEILSSLVFLVLPLFLLRGFHKSLPIYSWLLILMPLSTGVTLGMTRYAVVAFPAFFALARFGENRSFDHWIVFSSALMLCLMKVAFSNGFMIF